MSQVSPKVLYLLAHAFRGTGRLWLGLVTILTAELAIDRVSLISRGDELPAVPLHC